MSVFLVSAHLCSLFSRVLGSFNLGGVVGLFNSFICLMVNHSFNGFKLHTLYMCAGVRVRLWCQCMST